MQQKQAIWCLKCKSLDISLLFIELLYTINNNICNRAYFLRKNCTLWIIWNVNKYIFCPISWILRSLLMHFNRLNHAVKEHAKCARALINPFSTTRALFNPFITTCALFNPFITTCALFNPFITTCALFNPFITTQANVCVHSIT